MSGIFGGADASAATTTPAATTTGAQAGGAGTGAGAAVGTGATTAGPALTDTSAAPTTATLAQQFQGLPGAAATFIKGAPSALGNYAKQQAVESYQYAKEHPLQTAGKAANAYSQLRQQFQAPAAVPVAPRATPRLQAPSFGVQRPPIQGG